MGRCLRNTLGAASCLRRYLRSENQVPADFNQEIVDQFRANNGTMVSGMLAGAPLLLLTTRGARSGQDRVSPLVYAREGDRYVIFASKGGAPTNPDWFHNLRAHPEVTVEVRSERFVARASLAEGAERDRLFAAQAVRNPGFAQYQANTSRTIPVVFLDRVAS